LNEATKLTGFLTDENKEYLAAMLLGVKTDTLDIEGKIVAQSENIAVTEDKIRNVMMQMVGQLSKCLQPILQLNIAGNHYINGREKVFLLKLNRAR